MIEVFKTNIQDSNTAHYIIQEMMNLYPDASVNFDLEDCDNILRIESSVLTVSHIIKHINNLGYECEPLP
jgi:hypothetical protein